MDEMAVQHLPRQSKHELIYRSPAGFIAPTDRGGASLRLGGIHWLFQLQVLLQQFGRDLFLLSELRFQRFEFLLCNNFPPAHLAENLPVTTNIEYTFHFLKRVAAEQNNQIDVQSDKRRKQIGRVT